MDRDKLIMANARRLIKRTRMPNRELYSELFGTGSTTAYRRCKEMGIDPDGNICSWCSDEIVTPEQVMRESVNDRAY